MRIHHVLFLFVTLGTSVAHASKRKPVAASKPRAPLRIHVSKETTYFTSPLRRGGGVDYVKALNRHYGRGVTPERNAAIPFLETLRIKGLPEKLRKSFYQKLGIKPLPESGGLYVGLFDSAGLDDKAKDADFERVETKLERSVAGPWQGKDLPIILKWLDDNEELLEAMEKASHRPRFFIPVLPREGSHEYLRGYIGKTPRWLGGYGTVRATAWMLHARANLHLGKGRIDKAIEDSLTCRRWARLLEQDPWFQGANIAVSVEEIAFRIDQTILASGLLDAKQAMEYRRKLEDAGPFSRLVECLAIGDRIWLLDYVVYFARHGELEECEQLADLSGLHDKLKGQLKGKFSETFDINTVLLELNGLENRMVARSQLSLPVKRRKAIDRLYAECKADAMRVPTLQQKKPITPEQREKASVWLARWLFWELATSHTRQLDSQDHHHMQFDLTRIALALAAYRSDHKRFPDKLDKLKPKYISAIPADRFNGGPLHYSGSKISYSLYSVGQNGKDDGGRNEYDRKSKYVSDDLTIRMPKN